MSKIDNESSTVVCNYDSEIIKRFGTFIIQDGPKRLYFAIYTSLKMRDKQKHYKNTQHDWKNTSPAFYLDEYAIKSKSIKSQQKLKWKA